MLELTEWLFTVYIRGLAIIDPVALVSAQPIDIVSVLDFLVVRGNTTTGACFASSSTPTLETTTICGFCGCSA